MNYLILFLFIISAIAKSETDTIKFKSNKAWLQSDFWLGKKDIKNRSWLFKYPLSFLWDGWHLVDSVRVLCLCSIVVLSLGIDYYYAIALYVMHGVIFETSYIN